MMFRVITRNAWSKITDETYAEETQEELVRELFGGDQQRADYELIFIGPQDSDPRDIIKSLCAMIETQAKRGEDLLDKGIVDISFDQFIGIRAVAEKIIEVAKEIPDVE
jgi:hypothetical protein